jgi:hypothetical protein
MKKLLLLLLAGTNVWAMDDMSDMQTGSGKVKTGPTDASMQAQAERTDADATRPDSYTASTHSNATGDEDDEEYGWGVSDINLDNDDDHQKNGQPALDGATSTDSTLSLNQAAGSTESDVGVNTTGQAAENTTMSEGLNGPTDRWNNTVNNLRTSIDESRDLNFIPKRFNDISDDTEGPYTNYGNHIQDASEHGYMMGHDANFDDDDDGDDEYDDSMLHEQPEHKDINFRGATYLGKGSFGGSKPEKRSVTDYVTESKVLKKLSENGRFSEEAQSELQTLKDKFERDYPNLNLDLLSRMSTHSI